MFVRVPVASRWRQPLAAAAVIGALTVSLGITEVAAAAPPWRVFTALGAESDALPIGRACFDGGVAGCRGFATRQRFDLPSCVEALADGAIAACLRSGVIRVDRDGTLHPWLDAREGPGSQPALPWGQVSDVAATPDGGILAVSDTGLWRAPRAGAPVQVAGVLAAGSGVAALPDGAALVADGRSRVLRVDTDGSVTSVSADERAATRSAALDRPCDVASHGVRIIVAECGGEGRIRRIDADGSMTTLAGGGPRWREGARGTAARLGPVSGVAVQADGTILIAAGRLLALGRDGRVRTILRADDDHVVSAVNAPAPASLATDGAITPRAAASVYAVDALSDGSVLAADSTIEFGTDGRLLLLARAHRGPARW